MSRASRVLMFGGIAVALSAVTQAKGMTSRIVISGGNLSAPAEITDADVITQFQIGAGPGTRSCFREDCIEGTTGFIVDWPAGVVDAPRSDLPQYDVYFYVSNNLVVGPGEERLAYVVVYACDHMTSQGYVYLPGKGDAWFRVNARSIFRGLEGHWFRATRAWQEVVVPRILHR